VTTIILAMHVHGTDGGHFNVWLVGTETPTGSTFRWFNVLSFMWLVRSLPHKEFFRQFGLFLTLSNYSILFAWRPYTRCLRLIPPLPIPSIFPSGTCLRRRFLCNIWSIKLAFQFLIVYKMSLFSFLQLTRRLLKSETQQHHYRRN